MDKVSRAMRRYQAITHMNRRVKEHKQYPYCKIHGCWYIKNPYRMKEQPQICSCMGCGNKRKHEGPTLQEIRNLESMRDWIKFQTSRRPRIRCLSPTFYYFSMEMDFRRRTRGVRIR